MVRGSLFLVLSLLGVSHVLGEGTTHPASSNPGPSTSTRPAASHDVTQPNILLIEAGALSADYTGFEHHPRSRTPHLDKLAAQSLQFTRCYVPTPQDAPSRAVILTGLYPHANRVMDDETPLPRRSDSFTERLKRAGYACAFAGTWDLKTQETVLPGLGMSDYAAVSSPPIHDSDWVNAPVRLNGQDARTNQYLDDWHGDRAIEAMKKLQSKPFCLWVSFRGPNEPLVYPPGLDKAFPVETSDLPSSRCAEPESLA